MADETSYLMRQMRLLFQGKCQEDYAQLPPWDDDWEYYNQFSSQLSQESHHLIPYNNTNGYLVLTKNPETLQYEVETHDIDAMELKRSIETYAEFCNDEVRLLVTHVSIWCLGVDNIGHSCLFIFCPKTHTQWFFDPSGAINTEFWGILSSHVLLEGYLPRGICPCPDFQINLEGIIGAKRGTVCGLICSLVNLQLALSNVPLNDIMRFWKVMVENPLYWEQLRWCFFQFTGFYQNVFIDGNDDDSIL